LQAQAVERVAACKEQTIVKFAFQYLDGGFHAGLETVESVVKVIATILDE